MCNYKQVRLGCGHDRYLVLEWCTDYEDSHRRCPPWIIDVEDSDDERCGNCRPSIYPDWVVRTQKMWFKEFLVVTPTRPLRRPIPAVSGEKLQNKATCVRPRHSSLLTATASTSLLSPMTLLPLSCEPRSVPQSIQTCHPWFSCTMTDSIRTMITLGHSNLGDTTITTTGRAAGLVREKRKRISLDGEEEAGIRKKPRQYSDALVQQTPPDGLVDIYRRKQSFLDRDWHVVGIDSVVLSVSEYEQALQVQKNRSVAAEAIQLETILSGSRVLVTVSEPFLAQAPMILRNYRVLVEATQQLEKILSGSGDARILASKILSRLSRAEIVLLSCTTTIDREGYTTLTGWQRSGYWFDEKEEEAFCRKFSDFMPGYWDAGHIFDKWETFYKALIRIIHMWGASVCDKVWEADRVVGDVDYAMIIRKVEHQNKHRIHEVEKAAIRGRSGSIIRWDLVGMKVMVDVVQGQ